jgi:hypothetical protein
MRLSLRIPMPYITIIAYCLFFLLWTSPCDIFAQTDVDSLKQHVTYLSMMQPARNVQHPASLHKAADYIAKHVKYCSKRVSYQQVQTDGSEYQNIIASFGPENAPSIVIGAHYDVYGNAPGADHNASGVAGLLELARLLKLREGDLRIRIDVLAYTNAEPPYENTANSGSVVHAQSLIDRKARVLGMLNLNCIGYFTDQPRSQRWPMPHYALLYGRRANFVALIQEHGNGLWGRQMRALCKQYVRKLRVLSFKPAIPFRGWSDGDIKPYLDRGYPAILLTDTKFYRNRNFRYDIDTFDTLDYFRMAKVIDMVYHALMHYK